MTTELSIFLLLGIYFLVLLFWVMKERKVEQTVDDYLYNSFSASSSSVSASLFTLIGGGEFVTMALLGFVFGFSGISLFLGYALGFAFLAFTASRVRNTDVNYKSLPDYISNRFGSLPGNLTLLISFLAFFSLLVLQLSAISAVLTPFVSWNYETLVVLISLAVMIYLLIGGLNAVFITDKFQAWAMFTLMLVITFILFKEDFGMKYKQEFNFNEPMALFGLAITGFLVAIASADVWQRLLVAKSTKCAKTGLYSAAILFVIFGALLVVFGITAKYAGVEVPENAFIEMVSNHLPSFLIPFVVLMATAAIMSTADTEIFLLAALTVEKIKTDKPISIRLCKVIVVLVTGLACIVSLYWHNLVEIYQWVLNLILVLSPAILLLSFGYLNKINFLVSFGTSLAALLIGVSIGFITLDNAYYIVAAGLFTSLLVSIMTFNKRPK